MNISETLLLKTELGHIEHQLVFIKQTKHDFFAEKRRQGRNAEIEFARAIVDLDLDLDASVLRQAFFGNVELRHDLQTRDQRVAHLHRRMHHVIQNAVDAETDAKIFFVRLDVNVRCAAAKRVDQQNIDEANDRRVFAGTGKRGEIDLFVFFDDFEFFAVVTVELKTIERNI